MLTAEEAWDEWVNASRWNRFITRGNRGKWMKKAFTLGYRLGASNATLDNELAHLWGTCPGCGERKFIGHGPLCTECHLDKAITDAKDH